MLIDYKNSVISRNFQQNVKVWDQNSYLSIKHVICPPSFGTRDRIRRAKSTAAVVTHSDRTANLRPEDPSTSCRRAAATICPRPDLQVMTMHIDRSPLLYVHVGLPVQPTRATWWPWPFDLESGVRVACDVGYLCANFSLLIPLCSRVTPDVRDRQTDRRQTSDKSIA